MQPQLNRLMQTLDHEGKHLFELLARITLSEHAAEELLQRLVLRFVEAPERLEDIDNLGGYLRQSAMRLAFNWRRDQAIRQTEPMPLHIPDEQRAPSDVMELRERADEALRSLVKLPPANREAVVMRYLNEDSYDEISVQIGKSPHQVRSLCSKGVQMLRKHLSPPTNASIVEDD